jgi:hypothetical protein
MVERVEVWAGLDGGCGRDRRPLLSVSGARHRASIRRQTRGCRGQRDGQVLAGGHDRSSCTTTHCS